MSNTPRDALAAIAGLHPVTANHGVDADGYAEATTAYCPKCRTAAPCTTHKIAARLLNPTWRDVIRALLRTKRARINRLAEETIQARYWDILTDTGTGWICRAVYQDGTVEWDMGYHRADDTAQIDLLRDPTPARVLAAAEMVGLIGGESE